MLGLQPEGSAGQVFLTIVIVFQADNVLVPSLQVTVTRHVPGVVDVPVFHFQVSLPVDGAVFVTRPLALETVVRYFTTMAHFAPAFVVATAVAYAPALIDELRLTNLSEKVVAADTGVAIAANRNAAATATMSLRMIPSQSPPR